MSIRHPRLELRLVRWTVLAVVLIAVADTPSSAQTASENGGAIEGLSWRSIGPADMGGRSIDIAAIPGDPSTVYMATASGGLWKTTDGGTTWSSIFESGNTLSLGAVAVAPSDFNVVYLGTGENNPRNSASIGDGVYRSTAPTSAQDLSLGQIQSDLDHVLGELSQVTEVRLAGLNRRIIRLNIPRIGGGCTCVTTGRRVQAVE